jgi:hypothetical protein
MKNCASFEKQLAEIGKGIGCAVTLKTGLINSKNRIVVHWTNRKA